MYEIIKITASSSKKIEKLCSLIKELYKENLLKLYGDSKLKYIFNFINKDAIKNEINEDKKEFYFIEKEGINIGFLSFYNKENSIYLSDLFLKKEYTNKKIGTYCLNKIKKDILKDNIKKITTYIFEDSFDIMNIIEKWGFVKKENIMRYIGSDFFINEIKFELDL